jgi:pimeloyl-ACP methyl ester carboxylesterase
MPRPLMPIISKRSLIRMTSLALLVVAIPLLMLAGCQSRLIYHPRPYAAGTVAAWQERTAGRALDFRTSQGTQRAFLQGNLQSPRNLWIVCGGNGTVALDLAEWIHANAPAEDAWLLMDFPGYGDCHGSPSPERILENLKAAIPQAQREIGWYESPEPQRLRFFGHSLGAAACLMAATEYEIQRGVLIAPFTSTMEMSRHLTGLPLGFLVWHRFDNALRLKELSTRGPGQVVIFHGTDDADIPCAMSRKLAASFPDCVGLREIAGAGHNDIAQHHTTEVAAALRDMGKR